MYGNRLLYVESTRKCHIRMQPSLGTKVWVESVHTDYAEQLDQFCEACVNTFWKCETYFLTRWRQTLYSPFLFTPIYQGSFAHVKVGPTPVLALHNLWRQIHILEFGLENKKKYLEKTVLVIWSQTCGKIARIVCKITLKKIVWKFGLSLGKFWPLRTLWRNLHMFLDILEFKVENKKNSLGKTFLELWSLTFTRKTNFIPRIRQWF